MKIVCIKNPHRVWKITVGKIYEFRRMGEANHTSFVDYILDDDNNPFILDDSIKETYFISLKEWRNNRLKSLDIK